MKIRFAQRHLLPGILVAIWLPLACWGFWAFGAREFVPATSGNPDAQWPAHTTLRQHKEGYTLVVALHPECPCSMATVEELAAIMEQTQGRLRTEVLCEDYPDLPKPADKSRLWTRAAQIDGVSLSRDRDGTEARRFAALSSGEVRLYDAQGKLVFQGGITSSRGHVGPNPGASTVLDIVLQREGALAGKVTPAFGCPL